jgi:hypothetical protein
MKWHLDEMMLDKTTLDKRTYEVPTKSSAIKGKAH